MSISSLEKHALAKVNSLLRKDLGPQTWYLNGGCLMYLIILEGHFSWQEKQYLIISHAAISHDWLHKKLITHLFFLITLHIKSAEFLNADYRMKTFTFAIFSITCTSSIAHFCFITSKILAITHSNFISIQQLKFLSLKLTEIYQLKSQIIHIANDKESERNQHTIHTLW